jgi:tRNA pseudouridine55 synthase
VLPLVIGKATRLARFLSTSDKSYDAVIQLGWSTDTGDASGAMASEKYGGLLPARGAIEEALDSFRGRFLQQPPVYSAKKIDGHRSYRLARAAARRPPRAAASKASSAPVTEMPPPETLHPAPRQPAPVAVTVDSLVILSVEDSRVVVRVDCSAGFYVRSLAHDLGERLGTGGHLVGLRRTRSGDYGLTEAIPIDVLERDRDAAVAGFVPLALMLPRLPAVVLTPEGVTRARHGRELAASDRASSSLPAGGVSSVDTGVLHEGDRWIRLLGPDGGLVGLARALAGSGVLHPSVVLI